MPAAMAEAERRAPLSPAEPEVCEILLPVVIFELSDDDFLENEEEGQTVLGGNAFCLPSGEAEVVKEGGGAEGIGEGPLNRDVLRVKDAEKQATAVEVMKKEGFLDSKRPDQTEKEDGAIRDFGGDQSSDQRALASLNTRKKGERNRRDSVMKMAATVSREMDPVANKSVQECWPELPSLNPDKSINFKGTNPLHTGYNKMRRSPRKSRKRNEETFQSSKPEKHPNVADPNEQSGSLFVNGSCLPGDFSEGSESSRRDDRTDPESAVAGNLVSPEVTACQERHSTQENMNLPNENAESNQRLLMKIPKEASLPCDVPDNGTLPTSAKKTGSRKRMLCRSDGSSSVRVKKHICTADENNNNHTVVPRSPTVSSERCRKYVKKRKSAKRGRTGRSNRGGPKRDKDEERKGEKKDEKPFSKTKAPEPSESFCCNTCALVFSDPKDFSQHVKEHNSGPPYRCPQCEYASDDHSCFLNHLYWHAGREVYQCNFCAFLSCSSNSMAKHNCLHTGARPYLCAVCQLGFTSASGLSRHAGTHCQEQKDSHSHVPREKDACPPKTYVCSECNGVFYTQALFQSHKKHHALEKDHDAPSTNAKKCKTQGTVYEQANGSQEGETKSPNGSAGGVLDSFRCVYSCDRCSLVFHKEEHLAHHRAVHAQAQPGKSGPCNDQQSGEDTRPSKAQPAGRPAFKQFKCLQCAYMTFSFSNLRIHFATHTGEKRYKCQECGKSFRNSSHLKRHRLLHVQNRLKCSWCLFVAGNAEDLKLHEETCKDKGPAGDRLRPSALKREGSGEQTGRGKTSQGALPRESRARSHKCEHCAYSTYSLDSLKVHARIHTGEKPYTCNECQKTFRTSSHLRRHTLVHRDLTFNCGSCDHSASTWRSLKLHMASHGAVPLYKCEQCSYSTIRKENLKVHFRIHTGERRYECPHCARAFRTSSHLKKHVLTHLKLRCDQCRFSTLDKQALRKHARTHKKKERSANRKVYKCKECGLTFSKPCLFQAHGKKHKRIKQMTP